MGHRLMKCPLGIVSCDGRYVITNIYEDITILLKVSLNQLKSKSIILLLSNLNRSSLGYNLIIDTFTNYGSVFKVNFNEFVLIR